MVWRLMGAARSSGEGRHGEVDLAVLVSSIQELHEKVHQKQDTLRGNKTPLVPLDAVATKKMNTDEVQAMKDRLEAELEELTEQERTRCRKSFAASPLGQNPISDFSLGGAAASEQKIVRAEPAEIFYGQEEDFGLKWDRRFERTPGGPPTEDVRRRRRQGTMRKVSDELRVPFGKEVRLSEKFRSVGRDTHFFRDCSMATESSNLATAGGSYLLGRYDLLVTKVMADLDRNWEFIKGTKNHFWVAHAAALNIGESMHATDFHDFCAQDNSAAPELSEEDYLQAMNHIMMNITYAASALGTEHFIFFPFGMGAFLRHLGKLDGRFSDWQELQRLRRQLASEYVKVMAETLGAKTRVYLCLMFGDWEPMCNADAFLRALADSKDEKVQEFRQRVVICSEGDCLHLAQELGADSSNVMLVNGANRQLLGNHWFAGHAKRAIDENMHRRSWRMAATSYLLNNYGGDVRNRRPDALEKNVRAIGGTVHEIPWK